MSRATLRVRMGVTAASLIAGFGIATAPSALASPSTVREAPSATSAPWQFNVHPVRAHKHRASITKLHNQKVRKVLTEARRQRGKPYVYGEAGPRGFDCSGLVRFVFLHSVHRSLPHNAAAQYHSLRHIKRSSLQPGDLVFVDNGGYVSHVGIYDGHGYWWVAPHTGTHVQRQKIYRAHFVYARVLVYHKH
jgi:cell wall-associated NlpC family hydrolase